MVYEEGNDLYTLDFTPDGEILACGGKDGIVRVYDEKTKVCQFDIREKGFAPHANRIFCVKYNPYDPNVLVSAGWDNLVVFNDMRTQTPIGSILGPAICGDSVQFAPDGTILTGSYRPKESI